MLFKHQYSLLNIASQITTCARLATTCALFVAAFMPGLVHAKEHLVLIGGGSNRPPAALKQFAEWSSARASKKILIVAWASEIPDEVAAAVQEDLTPHFDGAFELSLKAPATSQERAEFLNQLQQSAGVFFTGGDQSRILEFLNSADGAATKIAIQAAYREGLAFAGTSAGTAIMSEHAIVGTDNSGQALLAPGLGLLPPSVVVDQHFSQRNRRDRLLNAQNQLGLPYGIGIDENTALLLQNGSDGRVVGENSVYLFVKSDKEGPPREFKFSPGDPWPPIGPGPCAKFLQP